MCTPGFLRDIPIKICRSPSFLTGVKNMGRGLSMGTTGGGWSMSDKILPPRARWKKRCRGLGQQHQRRHQRHRESIEKDRTGHSIMKSAPKSTGSSMWVF